MIETFFGALLFCHTSDISRSDVLTEAADSRLDLFNRRLKAQSARLKNRAVELLPKGLRTPAGGGILLMDDDDEVNGESSGIRRRNDLRGRGEAYKKEVEREVERIKVKVGGGSAFDAVVPGHSLTGLVMSARGEGDALVELVAVHSDRSDEG